MLLIYGLNNLKRNKMMEYEFRPYGKLQPIPVKSTGKIYEVGEHPTYKDDRIIEVYDAEGKIHDAFVDELTSEEVKQQERSYSEEEASVIWKAGQEYWKTSGTSTTFEELIKQFKKK